MNDTERNRLIEAYKRWAQGAPCPKKDGSSMKRAQQPVTESQIGKVVMYYREGWHAGTLIEIGDNWCKILKPSGWYTEVPFDDVRPA